MFWSSHADRLDHVDDHGPHCQGPHHQRVRTHAMPPGARRPANRPGRRRTAPEWFAQALTLKIAGRIPPA
jgi:hypothetical protein